MVMCLFTLPPYGDENPHKTCGYPGADNTYLINKPFTKDGKISQVENSPDFIVISLTLVQGMMSSPT